MTVIGLGTQKLRPQKNHTASVCDERCVTDSVQERQYGYWGLQSSSEHLTSEQRIGQILILRLSL